MEIDLYYIVTDCKGSVGDCSETSVGCIMCDKALHYITIRTVTEEYLRKNWYSEFLLNIENTLFFKESNARRRLDEMIKDNPDLLHSVEIMY